MVYPFLFPATLPLSLRYVDKLEKIFQNAPTDPTQDFSTQVAKLGHGLLSGEYSKPALESGDGEQVPEQKVSLGLYPFQTIELYRETKI